MAPTSENRSGRGLEVQDLILLMDHQRNVVTGLTVLIEQQKQINDKQNSVLDKLDNVVDNLGAVANKLSENSQALVLNRTNCSQEHSKIKGRIYLGWILMITVIGSLIGCAIQYSVKLESLTNVINELISKAP